MVCMLASFFGLLIWAFVVSSRRRAVKRDLIGTCALAGLFLILLALALSSAESPAFSSEIWNTFCFIAFFAGLLVSIGAVVWAHVGKSEIQPRGFPIEPLRSSHLESEDEIPK